MDGWSQHFKALVYYSNYLRGILRHLIHDHRLVIPEWDFYIGEGGDILNALHYYVIGDPFEGSLFRPCVSAQAEQTGKPSWPGLSPIVSATGES